jgi:hypothetical protein
MFTKKILNLLLKIVPQSKWNLFSNVLARVSIPNIGSPIAFHYRGFSLKEINLLKIGEHERQKILDFCYPLATPDRTIEIELDRQYWHDAATFIVVNKLNEIVGNVQFIPKKKNKKIPVEFGHVDSSENISLPYFNKIPNGKCSEVYRCRRSMNLKRFESVIVISMLFKAIWAKVIQTNTTYSYITFDSQLNELKNLYIRKLSFANPGVFLTFGETSKKWSLLVKDWIEHEKTFASLGKSQFHLITWVRKNLKKKNLRIRPVTGQLLSRNPTVLQTQIVSPRHNQMRVRNHILKNVRKKKLSAQIKKASLTINSLPS